MKVLKNYDEILTQGYNISTHYGIDVVGNSDGNHVLDYITSFDSGVVEEIRTDSTGFENGGSYGNYILINHNNGYKTRYAHLAYNTITVSKGATVNRGDVIGYMGATGYAFGGHLHFEIMKDGSPIDPTNFIFGPQSFEEDEQEEKTENNNEDINDGNIEIISSPKLIFTCIKEDDYWLHLKVGDRLYYTNN